MKRSNAATLAVFSTLLSSRYGRFCHGYLPRNSASSLLAPSRAFSAPSKPLSLPSCRLASFGSNRRRSRDTVVAFSTQSSSNHKCPLEFEVGPYNAAEVSVNEHLQDDDKFLKQLDQSINYWRSNDYTSAWVSVPTRHARLIEHLTSMEYSPNFGFDLHHTNATLSTIVLKKWLQEGQDKIPPFATHQVGCAGFVLNDRNEILLVKEWSGPLSNRTPTKQWKLPGGLLDAGESFEEATCREVWEETGIPCEFESI